MNGTSGLEAIEIEFEDGSGSSNNTSNNNTKFALAGTVTSATDSSFTINGFDFTVNSRTQFEDSLTMANIANSNIEVEGVESTDASGNTIYLVKEVEELETNDIDLEGSIDNGTLWGYSSDTSFGTDGTRIDVECTLVNLNTDVSNCRIDD